MMFIVSAGKKKDLHRTESYTLAIVPTLRRVGTDHVSLSQELQNASAHKILSTHHYCVL